MKKIIILLTLLCILFPTSAFAKGSDKSKNENKLEETISDQKSKLDKSLENLKEKKDELVEKAEVWLAKKANLDQRKLIIARMKDELSIFKVDMNELKMQTKQELNRQREKIKELRSEIKWSFEEFKAMGDYDKDEMKDFIEGMKDELKSIQKYRLAVRSVNIKDFFNIKEINKSKIEKQEVNTIIGDLK